MRQNGYPFAQAKVVDLYGRKVISVKEGKIGEASVSGNKHLSTKGILKNLDWNSGESFNYGKFQRQAAQLNRNRFVVSRYQALSQKGKRWRSVVDADFKVKDSVPISGNLDISNNGTPQSSGWRSKLGVEMWEPFSSSDRISFSYSTDPKETSEMQSYSFAYQANYGAFSHALFGGFSESEYSNQLSQSDFVFSDGMYLGFLGSYGLILGDLMAYP